MATTSSPSNVCFLVGRNFDRTACNYLFLPEYTIVTAFSRATSCPNAGDVVCSVVPRAGTALIFNHDTLHEGQPVTMGTKYIIRTEIMFRRVDREMIPHPMAYESDQNYIKTLALYQKSWQLEQGM